MSNRKRGERTFVPLWNTVQMLSSSERLGAFSVNTYFVSPILPCSGATQHPPYLSIHPFTLLQTFLTRYIVCYCFYLFVFLFFFYTFSVFLLNTSSATGALPKWSDIALHQPNSVSSFPESLEIARLFPTSFLFADLFWFPSPKNKFSRATSISQNYGIREKPR